MLGNRNKEVMIFDMVKIMRPNQLLLFSEKLELFICFFWTSGATVLTIRS